MPTLAWIVIALMCLLTFLIHTIDLRKPATKPAARDEDAINAMLFELQAKYIVAASELPGSRDSLFDGVERSFDTGDLAQRQRFIVVAGELGGPAEALRQLDELDALIADEQARRQDDKPLFTPDQHRVQMALREHYQSLAEHASTEQAQPDQSQAAQPHDAAATSSLSESEQSFLLDQLRWFGRLALVAGQPAKSKEREEVLGPARLLLWFVIALAVAGGLALCAGFTGLVLMVVFALLGKLRTRLQPAGEHHGLYAETFAVWMVLFLALQVAAGAVSGLAPRFALAVVFVAFMSSLAALAWPVLRGLPWAQVKRDIGWVGGQSSATELAIGAGSYFMALPVLAIGLLVTLLLLFVQQSLTPAGPLFEPPSGPAHPIVEQLLGPNWFPKIMVLALGAIAAPIVEETMFRGVLYGHLRGGTCAWGFAISVIFSVTVNSFIFAFIHPQGWVAIPALMSLAIAFSLAREWRGSILPAMVMHGMSNSLVLTMLITALTLSRSG